MRVIKKINNNAAVCQDNNGQELIALGKGIGFPKTPYELKDLSKIDMTFYRINSQTVAMLSSIPADVITTSTEIVRKAQVKLKNEFSPNVIFSLADHISFAIDRIKNNQVFDFSLSYDIEHLYPDEYEIGLESLQIIQRELKIRFPKAEATAIAMHFLNARENRPENLGQTIDQDMLQLTISAIENEFNVKINRNGFAFNRFRVHLQYFVQRIKESNQISGEIVPKMLDDLQESDPKVYLTGLNLVRKIEQKQHIRITDDEMFYLMIYIKRMIKRGKENE